MTFVVICRMKNGSVEKFRVSDVACHETARQFAQQQLPEAKTVIARVK